jgi:hypothetical protein
VFAYHHEESHQHLALADMTGSLGCDLGSIEIEQSEGNPICAIGTEGCGAEGISKS